MNHLRSWKAFKYGVKVLYSANFVIENDSAQELLREVQEV